MDPTILNLTQQPEELSKVHASDYYWYLRSPEFIKAFIAPLGDFVDEIGKPVLDVGCGEGYLAEHVMVSYCGFDGSDTAVMRAKRLRSGPGRRFYQGRLEDPDFTLGDFGTLVFGGLFSVLVKPERMVEFVNAYLDGYAASRFIVYDLERLDPSPLDEAFTLLKEYHADAGIKSKPDVYSKRQILSYERGA